MTNESFSRTTVLLTFSESLDRLQILWRKQFKQPEPFNKVYGTTAHIIFVTKMRQICLLLFFYLLSSSILSAATIRIIDGKEYEGWVKAEKEKEITFKTIDNEILTIEKANIYKRDDSVLTAKGNYPVLGFSLGTPAGLNLIAGYHGHTFTTHFSGMHLGTLYGAQLNVGAKILQWQNIYFAPVLTGGYTSIQTKEGPGHTWTYVGPGVNILLFGLFLEALATFGQGSYESPQFGAQVGYIYRFNKRYDN